MAWPGARPPRSAPPDVTAGAARVPLRDLLDVHFGVLGRSWPGSLLGCLDR